MMMVKVMVTRMMVNDDANFLAMMLTITFFGLFRINVTSLFSIASLKIICTQHSVKHVSFASDASAYTYSCIH